MKTSPKQISLFTEEQLTSSPEASPVNHTQWQASDLERKMSDTSGQRCLERFGKFSRHGLWAKTFSALLIGQEGWYSTKCRLIWKLKGTKYNRMYFQLAPSTHLTAGIEFGLLPTITASFGERGGMLNPESNHDTEKAFYQLQQKGLLPTPTAMDSTGATANMKSSQVKEGSMHSVTLSRWAGMLPTPCATESEKAGIGDNQNSLTRMAFRGEFLPTPRTSDERMHWKTENWKGDDLGSHINEMLGTRSHLSPQFVLEMMGFPTDWTALPFLNGETSQSKPEETP